MHAYLIVGGSRETRAEKLEGVLEQNEVGSRPGQRFALGSEEVSLKIEDVREAEKWVNLKRNRPAALIVEEADRLTLPAQHAFLKTLEEPGDNILIVLTAADTSGLLLTVRSRCKIIRLPSAAGEADGGEKFRKLLTGSVSHRLGQLYPILKQIIGSGASLHRGAVKQQEAIMFLENLISPLRPSGDIISNQAVILEAAILAHRRLKNNLSPTLTLHQFILDISTVSR